MYKNSSKTEQNYKFIKKMFKFKNEFKFEVEVRMNELE